MPAFEPSDELPEATGAVDVRDSDEFGGDGKKPPAIPLDELAGPDGGEESRRLAKYWLGQIEKVDDEQNKWTKRGKSIENRYRDERNRVDEEGQRRVNNLWANIQIMLPALYGRCPVPIAERRFLDKDEIGRAASQIIERALRNEIEIGDCHDAVSSAVMDYLLPGRGEVWVRYEPVFGPSISIPVDTQSDLRDNQGDIEGSNDDDQDGSEEKIENTGSRVVRESVPVDYVSWLDFYMFPAKARTWKEVRAIGKRVYMSRDEMIERFGEEIGDSIPLESEDREKRNQTEQRRAEDELDAKGEIYEIWDKDKLTVYWVAHGYEYLADRKDDPLGLETFFPVPRPLCANATNNTIIPVPDYAQYQDQAVMLDELTQRISLLGKACKIAGLYNASSDEISRLFDESVENELIPVDNWAAFAEKGGVEGQISLLPLKDIVGCLQELTAVKVQVQAELDRLSGIPDVLRGTGDARETMGGQRLKTNAGGTRLGYRQAEVARFSRDVVRLVAEIMCKHFSPKSLIEASGALYEEGLGPDDVKMLGFGDTAGAQPPQLGAPTPFGGPPPGAPPGPVSAPPPMPGMMPGQGSQGLPPQARAPAAPGMPPAAPPGAAPPAPPSAGAAPQQPPPGPGSDPMAMLRVLLKIKKAIDLLRDDHVRGFRIDIEIDSTVYGDQAQEKSDRVEFIEMTSKFLQTAMAISAQMPEAAPLMGKMLQFGVRGFRVGRDLESAIEEFCDEAAASIKKKAAAAQGQPNPEQMRQQADMMRAKLDMAKTQAEGQQLQVKAQADAAKAQADNQQIQMKAQADAAQAQADGQQLQAKNQADVAKAQAEVQRQQLDSQAEVSNSQADLQSKKMDMQMKQMEMEIEKMRLQVELAKLNAQIAAPGGAPNNQPQSPPIPGARLARDGKFYLPDHNRPGKYLMIANGQPGQAPPAPAA